MLFVLAILGTLLFLDFLLILSIQMSGYSIHWERDWKYLAFFNAVVATTILMGAWFKFQSLRQGGVSIALDLGARSVHPQMATAEDRVLLNVVEEMSLASRIPRPEIFVMDSEPGINAFAIGKSSQDSVIVVTRGSLEHLSRDELQGMIAHEFSHILNGDMALNMRLLGFISGIRVLADLGRSLMRTRSEGSRRSRMGNLGLLGLALFIAGYVGVFFGRLLQAGISRQREFLADASAVQFTRNPHGIAGALKKIGGSELASLSLGQRYESLNHFFLAAHSGGWFSSHPPLVERIKAIEPSFNGKFIALAIQPKSKESILTTYDQKAQERRRILGGADDLEENLKESLADPMKVGGVLLRQMDSKVSSVSQSDRFHSILLAAPAVRALSNEQFQKLNEEMLARFKQDGRFDLFEYANVKILIGSRRQKTSRPIKFYSLRGLKKEMLILLSAVARMGHAEEESARQAFESGLQFLNWPSYTLVPQSEINLKRVDEAFEALRDSLLPIRKKALQAVEVVVKWDQKIEEDEDFFLRLMAWILETEITSNLRV